MLQCSVNKIDKILVQIFAALAAIRGVTEVNE